MARISRPPGFDMTYRPERATFLLPFAARLPSLIYFGAACLLVLAIVGAPYVSPTSWLYREIVIGDMTRVVSSTMLAIFIFASAAASIFRQQLAGVVVRPDGIEMREILPFGMPRIRRLAWAQIDRVAIPRANPAAPEGPRDPLTKGFKKIRLDLWNGHHAFLPDVAKQLDLALIIERVALARAIPIEGGTGLVDDLGSPFGDEDADDDG